MLTNVLADVRNSGADHGPGLWERTFADGSQVVTNIRVAGKSRTAGSGLISFATGLLGLLGIGLFAVSVNAQYRYVFTVKHQHAVSFIEAIALDAAMAIFSLLALGLARAGKSAKIERALILVCALASAGMNYAAADVLSPRSVVAYVAPPLLLAVVVDRVVAVVRRHVLGEDETSPWRPVGNAVLYLLRFVLSPLATAKGARRAVLNATPMPQPPLTLRALPWPPAETPEAVQPKRAPKEIESSRKQLARTKRASGKKQGSSKQGRLIRLATEDHGLASLPLGEVSKLATNLAAEVDLHPATARRVLVAHARSLQDGGAQ